MVRDFTQATKDRLINEIDDINKKTWNPVSDFLGDVLMYAGKWIGILSLNDDMSYVEKYHRSILDMTDMTKKELRKIFDDVYSIDKEFANIFSQINEREKIYNSKLQQLYSIIKPNFSICTAETISSLVSGHNAKLKSLDGKITKNFEKELDWAAKEAALNSTKGAFGSVLKTVVDVMILPVSMIKNITTGNYGGIVVDTWALIDDVFAVGSNLVGLASLGIGYGVSSITKNNKQKNLAITYGEAFGGAKGLTDALKADQKTQGKSDVTDLFLKCSQFMDTASATIGLFSTAKGFLDNPKSMVDSKFGFRDKLGTLKKADMIEEYQTNYRHWQALYRKFGRETNYTTLKNISNGYKYLEKLWDIRDGADKFIESEIKTTTEGFNKWFKAFRDAWDLGEDIRDSEYSDYIYILAH